MNIYSIESPEILKKMDVRQMEDLAGDIRSFLIERLSKTGGHLSSNLGIVELTIALHKVFDSDDDKFIFDVGHQSYVHKILTGRASQFDTLRKYKGLSGFQKRNESKYDPWEAGHSSTSVSAALGMAIAKELKEEDGNIVAIIGDGALTGGEALEALNDLGSKQKKVIIIFNDNNMSISKNHSGFEKRITSFRTSQLYRHLKKDIKHSLHRSKAGNNVLSRLTTLRNGLKNEVVNAPLFESFNLDYIGPVDGHNLNELIPVLQTAKEHDGPIVVHCITQKGKGYRPAEEDTTGAWHGVGPFDAATGKSLAITSSKEPTWSEVISKTLIELASKDPYLVVITPAMAQGSKLLEFARLYPDRFFDAGIAEQHAVTMACGMAQGGLHPFVSIYSSFLQRAYDQVLHDAARMDLPVVFGVDRAGLVGEDGDTHQGVFDIAFLRSIPNVIICQPKNAKEAQNLLYTGFLTNHPYFIRYPRGTVHYRPNARFKRIEIGSWTYKDFGVPKQIVISYGPDVCRIEKKAAENEMDIRIVNARFLKPMDTAMLEEIFTCNLPVTIYETDIKAGGFSSEILEWLANAKIEAIPEIIGIGDHFVEHGPVRTLRKAENIDLEYLFERLEASGKDKT